jgi:hypothetical protein
MRRKGPDQIEIQRKSVIRPFLRDLPNFAIVRELTADAAAAMFDKLAMSAFERTPRKDWPGRKTDNIRLDG